MATIVIMPGGFHPFHAGHYALYQSAVKAFPDADVYVAATADTSTRPFPFAVKEKLAKLAGVSPNRFVQVKSPFKAEEITARYNPLKDTLIFVRSAKDSKSPPIPGGTKRDGNPSYLQPLAGQTQLEPFAKHAYMAYLPTVEFGPGMKSATEIRAAWPTLNEKRKTALVMSLYPKTQTNTKLAATVVKLLDTAMGTELNEFAPPGGGNDGDNGFSEETLKRLAAQWYNGDEDPRVEQTLAAAGWEIGWDEGYDDEPGVFVVQAGDVNGNSFISWPAHELKQGVAEGDVVPFKRPSTTLTWQDVPRNILLLANDWFWASEDDSGLAAVMDPKGIGNGTANAVQYAAAKLQQHGWSIDFNDEYDDRFGPYHLRLTNRRGQTVLLPIEDAQDFKGWAAGTNSVNENQGWAATLEESHVLDLTKNFSNHAQVHAQVIDVLPNGKIKLRIVSADPIPGKKPTVAVGQLLTMAANYLRRAPQVTEAHNFGRNVYFQVQGEKLPLAQAVKQSINFHPTNKDGVWKFSVMKNQNPDSVQGIVTRLEQMFGPRVSIDAVEEAVLGTAGAGMTAGYQRRENQPIDEDYIDEKWSNKYKRSINCSNPRGFSQRAHCAGRKK